MDWKHELTVAWIVKDAVRAADTAGHWQYTLPEVKASEEVIRATERILGFKLNDQYRTFLSYANGWKKALQNIDIHGTVELTSGENRGFYADRLSLWEDDLYSDIGAKRDDLYVIAGSRTENDTFVMAREGSSTSGKVFWLAGTLVETFPNFDEFFLSLVDYNRREIARMQGKL